MNLMAGDLVATLDHEETWRWTPVLKVIEKRDEMTLGSGHTNPVISLSSIFYVTECEALLFLS
jgi:hypothetical protein